MIVPPAMQHQSGGRPNRLPTLLFALLCMVILSAGATCIRAQASSSSQTEPTTISGTLHTSAGQPVADAIVTVLEKSQKHPLETKTDANGRFYFSLANEGTFTITAEKSGFRKCVTDPLPLSAGQKKLLDLVLESPTSPSSSAASMEFDDKPNFTVAGVTDWSGAGGHGSDTSLRTSEAFARETLALKPASSGEAARNAPSTKTATELIETEDKLRAAVAASPNSFEPNHQLGVFYLHSGKAPEAIALLKAAYRIAPDNVSNELDLAQAYIANHDLAPAREIVTKLLSTSETNANIHRLMGDLDEQSGDPLNAVREYERAATLDPSELNYFQWGSELLLHRAVAPSVIVFKKGVQAHPKSSRMRLGLGAALYSAGSYEDSSRELCHASDLNPEDATPYLFLGKMDITSPTPFPCIAEKLARFQKSQPSNPMANYYLAMAITKKDRESRNADSSHEAQALLEKSVALDPKFGEAYLQLGILYSAQGASDKAVAVYTKAIEVAPNLSEPHYRLSQLYKRNGDNEKAEQEVKLYKRAEKAETDKVERQRHEIQQFLVILKDKPPY